MTVRRIRRSQDGAGRRRAQLEMLHRFAARLNQAPDVQGIGEAVTSELRTLIDYHTCRVHLLDDDGLTLVPIAFRGELSEYDGETYDALVTTLGRGLTGHVAESRHSYYTPNANEDAYAATIAGTVDIEESILAAPLVFDDRLIGTVVLSKVGVDQFDDEDRAVLETVASHAAVAIENARARTEIERALETEREAAARLRAVDEMKNAFLRAVSHDLRTPLTVVLGAAITLQREDMDLQASEVLEMSALIEVNARKLDRLLRNLLDVERLARGVIEARRQPTDVAALVATVVEESRIGRDRIVHVDAAPIVVHIDPAQTERILENLLVNARRHTPDDATIWVHARYEDKGLLLRVEDDGPGIPPELRDVIFEPFRRGVSDDPSPGTGIGLSLVAQFAELHGGRAWVEDRSGGGASFRVLLPCLRSSPASAHRTRRGRGSHERSTATTTAH
ncbi:MAG: GAF domain-containing sensor histidine kinase [Actinomycetota bacterium]